MNSEIISREEAKRQGLKRYFTGKPCNRGHLSERYVAQASCIECSNLLRDAWRAEDPERYSDYLKQWRSDNEVAHKAYLAQWRKANPHIGAFHANTRRVRKLQAIPPWADLEAIKAFYEACPKGHEVDHVHPLKHDLICGLHVLENLQYLTRRENRNKSNKWSPRWDSNPQRHGI